MDNIEQPNKLFGKNRAILFILLDAFRWDYINADDSPTLSRLTKKSVYVKKLMTSSGFAQRSTISTGALPDNHGSYAMYTFDPATSPYKILSFFRPLLSMIPRKLINQIPKFSNSWAPPGRIPSEILHLISVKEDLKPIYKPGMMPVQSLYDKLYESNTPYKYLMAPVSYNDDLTEKQILSDMDKHYQVYFAQFSDTDSQVHDCGPNSPERKKIVKYTDDRVQRLVEKFEKKFENPWIVVIGDHGMVDVTKYIDIWNPVETFAKSKNLINGRDYLMFLDSTLARFWFFEPDAKKTLMPFLTDLLKDGEFMTEEYMRSRHIPINPKLYGELIWKANVGVGIFPDYFHWPHEKYKGMHGYDNEEDSMKGMAIFYNSKLDSQKIIDTAGLQDICSSLCDILDIPYPSHNQGQSIFKQP